MQQTKRKPSSYRFRGYDIKALARGPYRGPYRWNIWRPGEDLALCGVRTLAEAREVIEADRWSCPSDPPTDWRHRA